MLRTSISSLRSGPCSGSCAEDYEISFSGMRRYVSLGSSTRKHDTGYKTDTNPIVPLSTILQQNTVIVDDSFDKGISGEQSTKICTRSVDKDLHNERRQGSASYKVPRRLVISLYKPTALPTHIVISISHQLLRPLIILTPHRFKHLDQDKLRAEKHSYDMAGKSSYSAHSDKHAHSQVSSHSKHKTVGTPGNPAELPANEVSQKSKPSARHPPRQLAQDPVELPAKEARRVYELAA
jgi:hypothetical protein